MSNLPFSSHCQAHFDRLRLFRCSTSDISWSYTQRIFLNVEFRNIVAFIKDTNFYHCIWRCFYISLIALFCFPEVVQKQTLGEVGTWTVIWWPVMWVIPEQKSWRSFFKLPSIMLWMFNSFWDTVVRFNAYSVCSVSPSSADADVGWGGHSNSNLMASCPRNIRTNRYWNLILLFRVTINNVGDVFLRQCILRNHKINNMTHLLFHSRRLLQCQRKSSVDLSSAMNIFY